MKDRFTVAAVADPDEARAEDAAERTGAAIVTFEEAIARDDVDIVDLCTPPSLHLEQITAALAAGKHVVCEKPLVASLARLRRARRRRRRPAADGSCRSSSTGSATASRR